MQRKSCAVAPSCHFDRREKSFSLPPAVEERTLCQNKKDFSLRARNDNEVGRFKVFGLRNLGCCAVPSRELVLLMI